MGWYNKNVPWCAQSEQSLESHPNTEAIFIPLVDDIRIYHKKIRMVANEIGNGYETIPDEKIDAIAEWPKQGQTKLVEGLNNHGFVVEFPGNISLFSI